MDWEEDEDLPADWMMRRMRQGRMGELKFFDQVDGKAGRKVTGCKLEGFKGLIGLGGRMWFSQMDGW